jgi:ATP-dependent DNA helicase RecQ
MITRLYKGESERFVGLIDKYILQMNDLLAPAEKAYSAYVSEYSTLVAALKKWYSNAPFDKDQKGFVEENNIEKVDEFVMKSVVNKSGLKVFIIQNIDKKIALETIAKMKDLKLVDLLKEMETIVSSGTKLNLEYCIDDFVDEYDQEDMIDFFQSSESGNIDEAADLLKENSLSEEQFRLMRIKFMSEFAN